MIPSSTSIIFYLRDIFHRLQAVDTVLSIQATAILERHVLPLHERPCVSLDRVFFVLLVYDVTLSLLSIVFFIKTYLR